MLICDKMQYGLVFHAFVVAPRYNTVMVSAGMELIFLLAAGVMGL